MHLGTARGAEGGLTLHALLGRGQPALVAVGQATQLVIHPRALAVVLLGAGFTVRHATLAAPNTHMGFCFQNIIIF